MEGQDYGSPHDSMHAPPRTATITLFDSVEPMADAAGWLKFLGIVQIVMGVLYCLTIIGAIVGWVFIWIGVLASRAATNFAEGYRMTDGGELYDGMRRMATIIKIIGVLTIIGLVFNVIYIMIVIAALASGGF